MNVNPNAYSFVAFDATEMPVLLDISPHTAQTHSYLKDVCHKMAQAVKGFHELNGATPCPGWAKWKVIEWSQQNISDRHKFGAWIGDVLAGYIWLRTNFPSAAVPSGQIVYVEIMAAAPTNLDTRIWGRRFGYVGLALLAFAVLKSVEWGCQGRFGLHAADDDAAEYYRHLNSERGGKLFYSEVLGVPGVFPRENEGKARPFFETTADGALALLGDYYNG